MIRKLVGILSLALLVPVNGNAAPVWAQKPVQCATPLEVLDLVRGYGEVPFIYFEGATSRPDAGAPLPSTFLITFNKDEKTWTLIEIPHEDQACILGAGRGEINFPNNGIKT